MSSQRAREDRIIERLHAGTLALAHPSDASQPNPGGGPCAGCTEPDADTLVGQQPWHALCALFWRGRSATLRDERIPHTQPGTGITPARSRWVIVVPMDRREAYDTLRRNFARSPWVDVVVDRRRGERRQEGGGTPPVERRRARGRGTLGRQGDPTAEAAFRLAHQVDGCEVYEFTGPESGRCPECGAAVSVELPRFVEPPVRLELLIRHELGPAKNQPRHVVELQSFSPTGRVLLATRLAGRTASRPT
jgi:hypothetical protein